MPKSSQTVSVFVWQSLVVEGYRSFFYHLVENVLFKQQSVLLVAPKYFVEQGGQSKKCPAFSEPFKSWMVDSGNLFELSSLSGEKINALGRNFSAIQTPTRWLHAVALPVDSKHVQCVNFRFFYRFLRGFFSKNFPAKMDMYFIAEPYSITALLLLVKFLAFALPFLLLRLLAKIFPKSSATHQNFEWRIFLYTAQNLSRKMPLYLRAIQWILFRSCSGILSCGKTQHHVLRSSGFKGKIIDFPLWYDSRVFRPRAVPPVACPQAFAEERLSQWLSPDPTRLGFAYAGSLVREKGIEDLLSAIPLLPQKVLSKSVFYFAGAGKLTVEVQAKIRELQESHGQLGLVVHFLGPLGQYELSDLFQKCAYVVVPSRSEPHWQEQFGRVIIEAQACGAQILATSTGEIPNVVIDKSLLFAERNPAALAKLLCKLVESWQGANHELATRARQCTVEQNLQFSDFRCATRFASAMAELNGTSSSCKK